MFTRNSMNAYDKLQTPLETPSQQTLTIITATCGVPTGFSSLLFLLPYKPWESPLTREVNISITHSYYQATLAETTKEKSLLGSSSGFFPCKEGKKTTNFFASELC